ncbi:MAG TPA: type I methionyl aminopeptidase [Ktedonobacteraceae bacterium]|nr:type I methionyl aminopeptidase [Ktedonobacteraceae bacterium]
MSIESEGDLIGLARVGKIVALTLREMEKQVEPGITTAELDRIGEEFLERHGARSGPRLVYKFPGANCISVNSEAVHGIPGERVIAAGDVVKLDVTAELGGYMADAAITVLVPPVTPGMRKLANCASQALEKGINAARAGRPIFEIGRAVESEVKRQGFTVLRELVGHGVGRSIHEDPQIPNYFDRRANQRLPEGLVITIEPIISAGTSWTVEEDDGWTLKTLDDSLAAHFEHTMVITRGRPILLTALA